AVFKALAELAGLGPQVRVRQARHLRLVLVDPDDDLPQALQFFFAAIKQALEQPEHSGQSPLFPKQARTRPHTVGHVGFQYTMFADAVHTWEVRRSDGPLACAASFQLAQIST